MKFLYIQSICACFLLALLQSASAQNLVPFIANRFDLGSIGKYWRSLYINNVNASGNISVVGTLGVTGNTTLGLLQIGGPTTFAGFTSGILSTNASGLVSSGPLTVGQIPLLPYLSLTGGTLTGSLNGTNASFTGSLSTGSDAMFGHDVIVSNNLESKHNLSVLNNMMVSNDATISGNTMIQGNLQVYGPSAFSGLLQSNSANFTSAVTGPTLAPGDNSTNLATTAFVTSAISSIASSSGAWGLFGNSGTVDGTNFLGTTDQVPLSFRANNTASGRIDFDAKIGNTFLGFSAGAFSLGTFGHGIENTAVGYNSLSINDSGSANVAFGYNALYKNKTGSRNVGIGLFALSNNLTGTKLTTIGSFANVNADGYNNSTAIGNEALITGSNLIQLGNSAVTQVYAGTGTNATLIAGGLQITGGTLAAGNVLTSDALGNATWQASPASSYWNLTGNSGTIDGTNFIGTTDGAPLNFRINNAPAGRLDMAANSFFGYASGGAVIGPYNFDNTAIGYQALKNNEGQYNTAIGAAALSNNQYGQANTAIGIEALLTNTSGFYNVAIGSGALSNNVTGSNLTAIGSGATVLSDGFSNSTAIGYHAFVAASNTIQLGNNEVTQVVAGTGTNATLVAGGLQITGGTLAAGNVLTSDALGNATWQASAAGNSWSLTGNSGTVDGTNFIGTSDLEPINFKINNITAGRIDLSVNAFIGYKSGGSIGGSNLANTGMGAYTLQYNNGGQYNAAFGYYALNANQTGIGNTGIGGGALSNNISGLGNVGVGNNALFNNTIGITLSALGNNIFVNADGYSNSTAIGNMAVIDAPNEVILGNTSITAIKAEVTGITALSDGRFKKNVQQNVPGLEFINTLKPVTYNYDIKGLNAHRAPNSSSLIELETKPGVLQPKEDEVAIAQKEKILYTGLIAQDVEKAASKINYNFSGLYKPQNDKDTYGLSYVDFVVPLIKATQQLSSANDSLQTQITDLQNQLNEIKAQIASLVSSGNTYKDSISTISVKLSSAQLDQNAPNPFHQTTLISYYVPQTASNAMITITDMSGKNVKTIPLSTMGSGQLTLQTSQLVSGTYTYTLYVDGNLIDTKKMILAH